MSVKDVLDLVKKNKVEIVDFTFGNSRSGNSKRI